ncbi:MAG: efflux RND transporter periplasmic adaptor subunit, partial [Thermodesulfobacteriota bacterium]
MEMKSEKGPQIAQTLGMDQTSSRRKSRGRLLIALIALLLVGGGIWFWGKGSSQEKVQYKTQKAVQGDLTVIVTATGTL